MDYSVTPGSARRVVVVGGGNAALCAALSAREHGAEVTVLERAPESLRGGNSAFTAGAMRVAYDGVDDIRELVPELTEADIARTDFGSYPESSFLDDLARVTDYRADPELAATLVTQSFGTVKWMASRGVRFGPIYGRQAFNVDGRFVFWGGLTVEVIGGGMGLIEQLTAAVRRAGAEIRYQHRAIRLVYDGTRLTGVEVRAPAGIEVVPADAVVLAAGGFQANPEWRARYLGAGWELAKVRGTRFNTGDGIRMALEAGAGSAGHWSGCHAVAWDLNAPEFGDLSVGDGFQKHSYPFGIVVNREGRRFIDEGADFRNYTYAKYGREILRQPGQTAWQIFDAKVTSLLRDEYRIRQASRFQAGSLEELAAKLDGLETGTFLETVAAYNAAVSQDVTFNPNVKDGRSAVGITPPKSNWANTIDTPPFEAYAVTCGITFTFGGLRINQRAAVIAEEGDEMDGLFACGEMAGGLFYFNYPGGSGLTAGSVFGRIAGRSAAANTGPDAQRPGAGYAPASGRSDPG
jgi:tricarballylate dehydrogenase